MKSITAQIRAALDAVLENTARVWLPGRTVAVPVRPSVLLARRRHYRNGELIWYEADFIPNILHDEGEQYILSAAFDTDLAGFGAPPANLYLGLDARASLAEANTLASLSGEPSGNGYARQAIATTTGFTLTQPSAAYQAASGTLNFAASGGNWGSLLNNFLCTVSTGTAGKLISSVALSATRTVNDGDQLDTDIAIALSE